MTILDFKLTRFGRVEWSHLCPTHVEARRVLGWEVLSKRRPQGPHARCADCGKAKDTVLEATVAAAEASATDDTPKPVPVLPGQKALF